MRLRVGIVAGVGLLSLAGRPAGAPSSAQAGAADPPAAPAKEKAQEETQAERMLRLAREGSPVVRPQAARRLVTLGDAAIEAVLAASAGTPAGLGRLGKDVVLVLSELEDARLRALLWEALDDLDFPWRPAAAAGLASSAREDERARFLGLAADRLALVRVAALGPLAAARSDAARAALHAALSDPDARCRRAAVDHLAAAGERWALRALQRDLFQDDTFFDRDVGRALRAEAARVLRRHLPELEAFAAYDPSAPAWDAGNRAPLASLAEALSALPAGPPEQALDVLRVPPRPRAPAVAVLGLELTSCRHGELLLRLTEDDRLLVGVGRPVSLPLPAGTTGRVLAAAQQATAAPALAVEPGDARFYGSAGCDREVLLIAPGGDARALRAWEVSKGSDPVPDLRPEALGRALAGIVAALPEAAVEGAPTGLRGSVREALASIGGPLPTPPEPKGP